MIENIFQTILDHFREGQPIQLMRSNKNYHYIGVSTTRINHIQYQSVTYKISEKNSKRVTKDLIEAVYKYYLQDGNYPDINCYKENFLNEIKSRPCNKSVCQWLINQVL